MKRGRKKGVTGWIVMLLTRKLPVEVSIPAHPEPYKSTVVVKAEWAEGQVGVLPVFKTKKQAEAYRGDRKGDIIPIGDHD